MKTNSIKKSLKNTKILKIDFQNFCVSKISKISNTTSVYTTFSYKTNILFLFFVACDLKHFKVDVGNEPCKPCGAKSTSLRTSCKCSEDHHRAVGQNYNNSSPCYSKYLILSLLGKMGDMRLIESWTIEQWNFVVQNYEISY